MILPPTTNLDRVPDGLKDHRSSYLYCNWVLYISWKKSQLIQNKNNLRKEIVEIQHTSF